MYANSMLPAPSKASGPHGIWTFSLPTAVRHHMHGSPSPTVPQPSAPAGTRAALPLQRLSQQYSATNSL